MASPIVYSRQMALKNDHNKVCFTIKKYCIIHTCTYLFDRLSESSCVVTYRGLLNFRLR